MVPTLPKGLTSGAPVFGLLHVENAWKPTMLGHIARVTDAGYEIRGDGGRVAGFKHCPLFTSMEEAIAWAEANPPGMPTAP